MRTFLILWASLSVSALLSAQSVHISHCMGDCPSVSHPQNEVVVRHLFASAIDRDTGMAEWVAYRVLPDSIGVASLLPRFWQQEALSSSTVSVQQSEQELGLLQPDLSDAQDREYRINEFNFSADNRGRLTPMTSFAGTPYWDELNMLSNMSPLSINLRWGSWSRLNTAINELADESHSNLYVVTGPLYDQANDSDPTSYFKVVSDGENAAAFVFDDNLPIHAHHCDQISNLQQIESRLDRRLFPSAALRESAVWVEQLGCDR